MDVKECLTLIGIVLTAIFFWVKLRTDSAAARYRETINFLDKNTTNVKKWWEEIQAKPSELVLTPTTDLLGMLDTTALLIKKEAIDKELVYNYWWKYVVTPMDNKAINTWVSGLQSDDAAVLEHYCELQTEWKARVDKEQAKGVQKKARDTAGQSSTLETTSSKQDAPIAPESSSPLGLVASPETDANRPVNKTGAA